MNSRTKTLILTARVCWVFVYQLAHFKRSQSGLNWRPNVKYEGTKWRPASSLSLCSPHNTANLSIVTYAFWNSSWRIFTRQCHLKHISWYFTCWLLVFPHLQPIFSSNMAKMLLGKWMYSSANRRGKHYSVIWEVGLRGSTSWDKTIPDKTTAGFSKSAWK